MEEQLYT